MERIRVAEQSNITLRESGQTSLWSFSARRFDKPIKEGKQMKTETTEALASDPLCLCTHRPNAGMASDQLASGRAQRSSAPNPYRAGNSGGQVGQSESAATFAHPFAQRQGSCCEASDRKHWQTNPWRRWGNLDHARTEDNGGVRAPATRIPSSTAATHLHSEEQWCSKAPLHPDHARQSDASSVPAGPRPGCRDAS